MSTELVDPRYADIEKWQTIAAVDAMLEGQLTAVEAARNQAASIAAAADAAAARLSSTGRLVYVGAGTSGRIAVQDGVELFPTYNWPLERVEFLIAGGRRALTESVEDAEDDAIDAALQVERMSISNEDVVIGVAASGVTPFTVAVLSEARRRGALTIGISNNAATPILEVADLSICIETGGEIIAGSTRMKAGTTQKVVLNTLSTTIMIRLGMVVRGLMVKMRLANQKLLIRGIEIIRFLSGVTEERARACIEASGKRLEVAILIALGAPTVSEAEDMLECHAGDLGAAMQTLEPGGASK